MPKFFNKLESLRGIAAMAVVLYHSPFFPLDNRLEFISNSYLFVDFFFVLSGFVMTSAYRDRIAEGMKLRDYFYSRLGRIYPLHFVLLVAWVYFVFFKWLLYSYKFEFIDPLKYNTIEGLLSNLMLFHSLNILNYTSWNYPSWSISVEFATYFIFFGFVVLTRKTRNPLYALGLCVAVFWYVFQSANWSTMDFTVINGIYRCCGGFFAGVFLFQATGAIRKLNVFLTAFLEIVAVGLVWWMVANASQNKLILFSVVPAFVFAVYVFSLENDGIIGKLLKFRPFTSTGKYSYSIYMTHALLLDIAFTFVKLFIIKAEGPVYYFQSEWSILINLFLLLVVFAVSAVTYKIVEKRWMTRTKDFIGQLQEFDLIEEKKSILA